MVHGGGNDGSLYYKVELDSSYMISNITYATINQIIRMDIYVSEDDNKYDEISEYPIRAKYIKFVPYTVGWAFVQDIKIYRISSFLSKDSSNMLYSINDSQYSVIDKKYIPLVNNSIEDLFKNNSFDLVDMTVEVSIDDETFRPIDKFDTITLCKKE